MQAEAPGRDEVVDVEQRAADEGERAVAEAMFAAPDDRGHRRNAQDPVDEHRPDCGEERMVRIRQEGPGAVGTHLRRVPDSFKDVALVCVGGSDLVGSSGLTRVVGLPLPTVTTRQLSCTATRGERESRAIRPA